MSTLEHTPVAALKKQYGLVDFVETGLYQGEGLRHALSLGFMRCFTCDIFPNYVDAATAEFNGYPGVSIQCSDSLAFLAALPPGIGPCFYWLDAHHPMFYGNGVDENDRNKFPVMHELAIIKKRQGFERDVIMLDDLICVKGSPRWNPGEIDPYYHAGSFTFEELVATMKDTHEAEVDLRMEGLLIFKPK